jgi:acylphosphatase
VGYLTDAPGAGAAAGQGTLLRIDGRVQGVGFRAFVRARACALGLTGWTCNLADGGVAVAVAGSDGAVKVLVAALRRGPSGAAVTHVRELGPIAIAGTGPFAVRSDPPRDAADRLVAAREELPGT